MKKLLFVLNPHAGKARVKNKLSWIVDYYIKQGFRVEVYMTQERGDGARVITELAGETDHLVVSGGHGTDAASERKTTDPWLYSRRYDQ